MMNQDNSNPTQYSSLTEIRLRKELLQKDIEADDARIKALWKSLFSKPDALSKNASPSKRMQSLFSIGVSAFDGALSAWKLYRKFKKT